jgi:hypothetical protein
METKTCIFGYGGIQVSTMMQMIVFKGIKPPMGAGTRILDKEGNKIGDWEYTGSTLTVLFDTMTEIKTVCDLLSEIEKNQGGSFTFKGITFDFTRYEQASMNIVKTGMGKVKIGLTRLMAC